MCWSSDMLIVIKHIQEIQFLRNISQRLRCHQLEHGFYHKQVEQSKFCIVMDNFLTVLGVMPILRAEEIGCFGTSRFQKGDWSPTNIRDPTKEK